MVRRSYTEQDLRDAVKRSSNYAQTLRALGLNVYGSAYPALKRAISQYEIDISHFTFNGHNSGKTFGPKKPIQEYLTLGDVLNPGMSSNSLKKRLWKEGLLAKRCEICKITEWQGVPAPLELDHINGNRYDNRIDNLRILCSNCHSLTPTNCRGHARVAQSAGGDSLKKSTVGVRISPRVPVLCADCGKQIDSKATRCKRCAARRKPTKIDWPSVGELKRRLESSSYTKLAKELGVSDNAIRKRISHHLE